MKRRILFQPLLWFALLCWAPPASSQAGPATGVPHLWSLYQDADYFALRAALPPVSKEVAPEIVFLHAATLAAFAHIDSSARLLDRLLARRGLDATLEGRARELLMLDRRSLFLYRDALRAVAPLLQGANSARHPSVANRARLLRAIADVGPQTVSQGSHAALASDPRGRIHVVIAHRPIQAYPDTGANISVLPLHIARMLGIRIRPANYAVGSSAGGRVRADVAVADISLSDGTRVQNAIFLVLPDKAVPVVLLGYPVLSALGSIDYSRGAVAFGSPRPTADNAPLALSGNDVLLEVQFAGQGILCRLDSGSSRSVFYAPFYRRFGSALSSSDRRPLRIGGATGTHKFPAREIDSLTIKIAGRSFRLAHAMVITETVRGVPNSALACNIGRDLLRSAGGYRIDFVNMTLSFGT